MITRAWFRNFKSIDEINIKDIGRFMVLVGPNGSGKTSVLDGLAMLSNALDPRRIKNVQASGLLDEFHRKKADAPLDLGMCFHEMHYDPVYLGIRGVMPDTKRRSPTGWSAPRAIASTEEIDSTKLPKAPPWLRSALKKIVLLRLDPGLLSEPSDTDKEVPSMTRYGEGLASVIADMILSEPDRLEHVLQHLRKLFPSLRRIRVGRAKLDLDEPDDIDDDEPQKQRIWGHQVLLDTVQGDGIPLDQASEGMILTLGMLTILYSKAAPRILLWDDMDKALHPKAQQDLIRLIRALFEEIPGLQIIGTTHSPYLLDELAYDEVRIMATRDNGTPVCAPLKEHPEYERWKTDVKPGELWMSYLEHWVKEAPGTTP